MGALGCLGRGALRYQWQLLALLTDDSNHVRYASLVTLGGLLAKAKPHSKTIARHLNDKDAKCRMASLRALKCMGHTAAPYIEDLKAWQQRWFNQDPYTCLESEKKPEPITTRAILFPNIPLKDLFRGHAPLGKRFAGPEAARNGEIMKMMLKRALASPTNYGDRCDGGNDDDADLEVTRERRAAYMAAQARYRAADAARRQQQRQQRALRRVVGQADVKEAWVKFRLSRRRSSCLHRMGYGRGERTSKVSIEGSSDEWVIPVCR